MDLTIDDAEQDVPALSPICTFCARLNVAQRRRCTAFGTAEIPLEIWEGQNDHRTPYAGDHGLQFIPWNKAQGEH